ncbi:MAG: family 20 glycosylhydrolase [Candidatus Moduliflexus flocculans]|nr:family 20 glycosylhydrolase [Candidatus Moduliflexus flocculans]
MVHIGGDEVDKAEWKRCPKCRARMKAERPRRRGGAPELFRPAHREGPQRHGQAPHRLGRDPRGRPGTPGDRHVLARHRGRHRRGQGRARRGHVADLPLLHRLLPGQPGLRAAGHRRLSCRSSKVYAFEPVPDALTEDEAGHVLGGQANLWTEYISDGKHAEYMALPRLAALAEAVWSPKNKSATGRNSRARFGTLMSRYAAAGLNAARSAWLVAIEAAAEPGAKRVGREIEHGGPRPRTSAIRRTGPIPGPRRSAMRNR